MRRCLASAAGLRFPGPRPGTRTVLFEMSLVLSPPAVPSADDPSWTTQRRLLDVVIVLGIALRLIQYCASVSVWLDEATLALDVRESSLIALLIHPLARMQIAPKGFLLVQGIIFRLAGDGEYALRFFPLGCSILGLLLFRRLALRALEPGPAVIATLGFALASPLIRFAAEGKPYGLDATRCSPPRVIGATFVIANARRATWLRLLWRVAALPGFPCLPPLYLLVSAFPSC